MKIEKKDIYVGTALVNISTISCPIFAPFCFFREDGMVEEEIRRAETLSDGIFRMHHPPPCLKFEDIDIEDLGGKRICDFRKFADEVAANNPRIFELIREYAEFDRRMRENVEHEQLQYFLQVITFGLGSILSSVGNYILVVPEKIINAHHKYSLDQLKTEMAGYGDWGKILFAHLKYLPEKKGVMMIIKMFIDAADEYLFEKFLGDTKVDI